MSNSHMSCWTGSLLDIHEAGRLVSHQNATTVLDSVFAALCECKKNIGVVSIPRQ
jgi:homospermidine synthase